MSINDRIKSTLACDKEGPWWMSRSRERERYSITLLSPCQYSSLVLIWPYANDISSALADRKLKGSWIPWLYTKALKVLPAPTSGNIVVNLTKNIKVRLKLFLIDAIVSVTYYKVPTTYIFNSTIFAKQKQTDDKRLDMFEDPKVFAKNCISYEIIMSGCSI